MRQKENTQMIMNDTYINENKIPLRYYYQLVNEPEQAYQKQHQQLLELIFEQQQQKQLENQIEKMIDDSIGKLFKDLKLS